MLKLAILSDSLSTFEGYIPNNYESWYKKDSKNSNVHQVEQTWWYKLCTHHNLELAINCSYSGSTISNVGYEKNAYRYSFITRMKEHFHSSNDFDLIIIMGGTNDSWLNNPLGSIKYHKFNDKDYEMFSPSFSYICDFLRNQYPEARILNVIYDEISEKRKEIMQIICKHYKIPCISLKNITKNDGHPNKLGMEKIYEQISHSKSFINAIKK